MAKVDLDVMVKVKETSRDGAAGGKKNFANVLWKI